MSTIGPTRPHRRPTIVEDVRQIFKPRKPQMSATPMDYES